MTRQSSLLEKASVAQWGIGLAHGRIEDVIRHKALPRDFVWLTHRHSLHFQADPFLVRTANGRVILLYEDFGFDHKGRIAFHELGEDLRPRRSGVLLEREFHLSYPSVTAADGQVYVVPESHAERRVSLFALDVESLALRHEATMIEGLPLVDSTLVRHGGLYWLFATLGDGLHDNRQLHLFFSGNLSGPFAPHPENPVKDSPDGCRPAGNIISVDGRLFRPAQNCAEYYGKSITINEIRCLSTEAFEERPYCTLDPIAGSPYKRGLHTLSWCDGIIAIDGSRLLLHPWAKVRRRLRRALRTLEPLASSLLAPG